MANIQYYDVILKPVVTEKSMELMGEKKYTFLVHPEATKSQVKEAVEKMFDGAKVKSVNTMNYDGKKRRVRGTMQFGKTAKSKKDVYKRQDQDTSDRHQKVCGKHIQPVVEAIGGKSFGVEPGKLQSA